MAYHISADCIGCGICKKICPTKAIQGIKKELHQIKADACIECGSCGRVCPSGAVKDPSRRLCEEMSKKTWPKPDFKIKSCTSCRICVDACPVSCIDLVSNKAQKHVRAYPVLNDPAGCLGCGLCAADCPADAIVMQTDGHG